MEDMKLAKNSSRGKSLSNFVCISLGFLIVALVCLVFSYAYLSDIDSQTKTFNFANITWKEVSNSTENLPIEYVSLGTANSEISRAINTNIKVGIRARIAPEWKDAVTGNRVQNQPPINYVLSGIDAWMLGNNGVDFYYNIALLPSENDQTLNFNPTITFNDENASLYAGLKLTIGVTFEYHQVEYVDYGNHPWAETAPSAWLNTMKG